MRAILFLAVSIAISALVTFSGCRECSPSDEKTLHVSFRGSKQFNMIKSLDPPKILFENNSQSYFSIPLAISQEKMTFVFSNGTLSDTLSISYTIEFELKSARCGYVYEVNDMKVIEPTSFKDMLIDSFYIEVND